MPVNIFDQFDEVASPEVQPVQETEALGQTEGAGNVFDQFDSADEVSQEPAAKRAAGPGILSSVASLAGEAWEKTPAGLITGGARKAIQAIPIPSQETVVSGIKKIRSAVAERSMGIPFGGGFQGLTITGENNEESAQRSAGFARALAEQAKGLADFSLSLPGIATTAIGGPIASSAGKIAGPIIRTLLSSGWATEIGRHLPEQYQQYLIAHDHGTPEEQEFADVNLASGLAMFAGAGAHATRGVAKAPALASEVVGKMRENAALEQARKLGLTKTAEAVRPAAAPVSPAPPAPAVPTPTAAPALPAGVERAGTMAGRDHYHYMDPVVGKQTFAVPAGSRPEVIAAKVAEIKDRYYQAAIEGEALPPEATAAVVEAPAKASEPAAPVPAPAEAPKPAEGILERNKIAEVESASPERWQQLASEEWKESGGLTGKAHEVGRTAKTPEEVAELKAGADRMDAEAARLKGELTAAKAKGQDIMPILDAMAPIGTKKQFFREAYEAATGTGSAGDFLRKRDPNYQPPFPEGAQPEGVTSANQIQEAMVLPSNPPPGTPTPMAEGAPGGIRQPERALANQQEQAPQGEQAAPVSVPRGTLASTQPGARGIAKNVRRKWTTATADQPLGNEAGSITLEPIKELWEGTSRAVRGAWEATKAINREAFTLPKTSDYRRSVLNWSSKLQTSFSEVGAARKEIQSAVPTEVRRDGITNWIEAGGDRSVLQQRLAATQAWRDPITGKPHPQQRKLIAGYEAALSLTPEELAVAGDVKAAFDDLGQRGNANDVLNSFRDNYVTHVWDQKRGEGKGFASGSTLKDRFKFSKARSFDTFFDGEQAGYVPATKDVSKLLPTYLHEMNSVIAARQLVAQMAAGTASDGRPLLAPRGKGVSVGGEEGQATLIMPESPGKETGDYVRFDRQPALHDWRWAAKDTDGNPIFLKGDLVVHPEAAAKLRNVLGRSAIKQWYESKTGAMASIPKAIVKGIDVVQSETKRTMLGLLAPFHQTQEGTHAIGHRVNPSFNNPEIDLSKFPEQRDAARHGLMLAPDSASASEFMEGFQQSGIVSRIPGLGPLADRYASYLFDQYIPGLKFKTYQAILRRNQHVFAKDLASGRVNLEDVKILSSEQSNAAYGHLNYADLGRNPTIQHLMRLGLLAPDFLEARMRFAGQGIKGALGAKVGREQVVALATLAVAQATLAYAMSKVTGGQWDAKDPFVFHVGNRKYTMRSVPEDAYRLMTDSRAFIYARLNPLVGRGAVQYLSGTDWRGQKVTALETAVELAKQPIPLTLRPLFGNTHSPLTGWEQLLSIVGIVIKRYSAQAEMRNKASDWMLASTDTKIKSAAERYRRETFADSEYKPLREALINQDFDTAKQAYLKLLETRTPAVVSETFLQQKRFTGNVIWEERWLKSLSAEDKLLLQQARREQAELVKRYQTLIRGTKS